MLVGLYILMPLLSPWAEKVSARELRGWIFVWLATTLFPFLRQMWVHFFGEPPFGRVPYLFGECPWNHFGAFHYVSGFIGYMLLGLWFRRFVPQCGWRAALRLAVPMWLVGAAIMGIPFFLFRGVVRDVPNASIIPRFVLLGTEKRKIKQTKFDLVMLSQIWYNKGQQKEKTCQRY